MADAEETLWEGRPSQWVAAPLYLGGLVASILLYQLLINYEPNHWLLIQHSYQYGRWLNPRVMFCLMLIGVICFIIGRCLLTFISLHYKRYGLTNQRLFIRHITCSGFRRDQIELYRVIEYILLRPFYLSPFRLSPGFV